MFRRFNDNGIRVDILINNAINPKQSSIKGNIDQLIRKLFS